MVDYFASRARNQVSEVDINYSVDRSTNTVTVSHDYLDFEGNPIDTIVGMHPMHWKFSDQTTSNFKIRSARGVIKFAELSSFEYQIPFVGVLPLMPSLPNTYDQTLLNNMCRIIFQVERIVGLIAQILIGQEKPMVKLPKLQA